MKPRILVVGSFVMDLIATTSKFPSAGETIIGNDFSTAPGGKGANQAIAAARLGAAVSMVGKVGDDSFGREMLDSANKSGVDTSNVTVSRTRPSAVGHIQIQTNEQGTENRILVIPGANMDITPENVGFLEEEIKNYDMVMLQLEIPMEINCLVAKYAKAAGVPVMLNPAPADKIPAELLSCLTYISPNEHEAAIITGIEPKGEEGIRACVSEMQKTGVENVIITLGKEGCAFCNGETVIISPCVKAEKVVDPTAAGDSFMGAFCTAVSAGIDIKNALLFANCVGSITVSKMGAQTSLPILDEVFELMNSRGFDVRPFEALKG